MTSFSTIYSPHFTSSTTYSLLHFPHLNSLHSFFFSLLILSFVHTPLLHSPPFSKTLTRTTYFWDPTPYDSGHRFWGWRHIRWQITSSRWLLFTGIVYTVMMEIYPEGCLWLIDLLQIPFLFLENQQSSGFSTLIKTSKLINNYNDPSHLTNHT